MCSESRSSLHQHRLDVLKRCVPKTLAFAFRLRLRSKTRCFKTGVLGMLVGVSKLVFQRKTPRMNPEVFRLSSHPTPAQLRLLDFPPLLSLKHWILVKRHRAGFSVISYPKRLSWKNPFPRPLHAFWRKNAAFSLEMLRLSPEFFATGTSLKPTPC